MPGPRFVRSLSKEEQKALRDLYRRTDKADVRSRCQMILLSSEEYPVSKIADLTLFTEDSILYWFARYEEDGLRGLDAARSPSHRASSKK